MLIHPRFKTLLLALALLPLGGCLRTSHPVQIRMSTATLKEATLEELVNSINTSAERLNSFKATVDIDTSVLERKKGDVKDYPQIRGYVLLRKPEMLRMVLLVPVVRNTMFDMVSNGKTFELSVPSQNKFVVGSSKKTGKPSEKPLENLRPQHILEALQLRPVDTAAGEVAVLDNGMEIVKDPKTHKDVEQSDYEVLVIARDAAGAYLSRKIIFSRTDLLPHEQLIYDRKNRLVTRARYENFADHSGIMFPEIIGIERPVEAYSITMSVVNVKLNEPLSDEQFVLAQPPGSKLVDVDDKDKEESGDNRSSLRSPRR
jgi:outer membrane lipoprotein-sorting protein